jgi:hypothetical protein
MTKLPAAKKTVSWLYLVLHLPLFVCFWSLGLFPLISPLISPSVGIKDGKSEGKIRGKIMQKIRGKIRGFAAPP